MMRLSKNREDGFTLVEVVVFIIIAGILAGVAFKSASTISETARIEETKQEMDALAFAIAGNPELEDNGYRTDYGYVGDIGALPGNLDALVADPGYQSWNGPYISNEFSQVTTDFKTDAWGSGYSYGGGVTITSTGSGSNIVRRFASGSNDLFSNTVSGQISDFDGTPPGATYDDSLVVRLTYPDGSGSYTVAITSPDEGGYFEFSSVPIGVQDLTCIYLPVPDTLERHIAVNPNSKVYSPICFGTDYWNASGGSTPGGSISELLRPNGSGDTDELDNNGCSDNWQCVDETSSDDDGSYVTKSDNSWKSDSYSLENSTVGTGTVDSLLVHIYVRKTSNNSKARTLIRTNGSNYSGWQINLNGYAAYTNLSTTYVNNPQTGSAWTWTEIDDLEAGVEFRHGGRCSQVWVEVFYTN